MTTRIYLVTVQLGDVQPVEHLIEAASAKQAIYHAAQWNISAEIAKPKKIAELMKANATIKVAGGAE